MIIIKNIHLEQTCGACPEQYYAYYNGALIGYLRLRHGCFRVDYPDCGGETILVEYPPESDGCFGDDREYYLTKAVDAIRSRHGIFDEY